jgi:excisionase family DNA binding protein
MVTLVSINTHPQTSAPQGSQLAGGLLNKGQIADRLGVSARTVDTWMKSKRVPYLKIGRTVRFRWESVLDAIEKYRIA